MNKFKSLFFAFSVAVLTTVTASAATFAQKPDFVDFFNFDLNRTWSYSSFASVSDIPNSNSTISVTSGKCYEDSECVRHYYPDFSAKFRLNSNGDVVVYKVDSDELDDVVVLSNDSVSQVVPEVAFPVFGIDWIGAVHDVAAANMTCDAKLISGVKYSGDLYDVLAQNCAFEFTNQWGDQTIHMARYYFDGVGLMQSAVVYNYDDNQIVSVPFDVENFFGDFNFVGDYNWNPSEVGEFFYNDVSISHKNYEAIAYMFKNGIMNGYEDGSFRASKRINRAELLKVLVEAVGPTPSLDDYNGCFSDVVGEWYEVYACYAKEMGWISGYPNGKFQGSDSVNKVEALKMMLNVFDVELIEDVDVMPFADVELGAWFTSYVSTAKEMGLLEMDKFYVFDIHADMRRGEIAETLYRLMSK